MKARVTKKEIDHDAMLIEERRLHILALVQAQRRVLVQELSEHLGVSLITIRKDLDALQAKGMVQRTHGGAILVSAGAMLDPSLEEKTQRHLEEKQRIARAAARIVKEGQCVMVDSGTTTTAVAHALRRFEHLTVITNAINIVADLADTNFDVILTGGTLRKNSFSLVGPLAEDVLEEMHADVLFLGVDGFDLEIGLTTPNLPESRVNRAMVKAARKVVVVCDSSKFHRRRLSWIIPPSQVHCVITDHGLSEEDAEALRDKKIEVIVA